MGTNLQNNLIVQFKGDVTTASTSVAISTDLERGAVVTASGCYAVIRNKNGSKIERVKGDAAAGTFTFTKRGLDQSDTDVEVSGLKKSWKTGQTMYITLLSSQIVDKQNSNTYGASSTQTFDSLEFTGTSKGRVFANLAALNAAYPTPVNGLVDMYCTAEGQYFDSAGGSWVARASGTNPNASTTVAGRVELATAAERAVATGTGGTGALLVPTNDALRKVSSGAADENMIPILNATGKLATGFVDLSSVGVNLIDNTYYAGEAITAGQAVFVEPNTTFVASTTLQNIGDVTANTRVAIPIFGTGINFTTLKLALRKFVAPGVDLGIRIETDNAGNPSGTIVTNGSTTVTSASLTTSLVDTTATFGGNVNLTIGQRFWIVLFAGTYGSETINATNYFAVGYNTSVDTTTRIALRRNATTWSSTYLAPVTDADNITLSLTASPTDSRGYRIQAIKNIILTTINKSATCTATRAVIRNEAGTILTTQAFSGNIATLATPQAFTSGTFFRVEADNSGASYTAHQNNAPSFPQVRTNVTYNTGSIGGVNDSSAWNIDSIITEELNTSMTYVSSTGIESNVLSLTDADFTYKIDFLGLSTNTVVVGGQPNIAIDGVNPNQSGLVYNQVYYVSNTPGAISTTAGTNSRYIGRGISSNKILIKPYHQF